MELKLLCGCGQKFKFDVEPVNGLMPFAVNCPACGTDGTAAANALLTPSVSVSLPPPITAVPVPSRLQINRPVPTAAPEVASPPVFATPPPPPIALAPRPKVAGEFNMGLGIFGALAGAGIGVGLMFGFYQLAGFRFPFLGVGTGALTGYGAKLLYKGTSTALGVVSGVIAMIAVIGTLYLMYGVFPMLSILSVIFSIGMAYRIASG